jgi:hypothetical protein
MRNRVELRKEPITWTGSLMVKAYDIPQVANTLKSSLLGMSYPSLYNNPYEQWHTLGQLYPNKNSLNRNYEYLLPKNSLFSALAGQAISSGRYADLANLPYPVIYHLQLWTSRGHVMCLDLKVFGLGDIQYTLSNPGLQSVLDNIPDYIKGQATLQGRPINPYAMSTHKKDYEVSATILCNEGSLADAIWALNPLTLIIAGIEAANAGPHTCAESQTVRSQLEKVINLMSQV